MIRDRTEDAALVPVNAPPERPRLPDLCVKPPPAPLTPDPRTEELSPHPHSAPQPNTPALSLGVTPGLPSGSVSGVSPQNRRVKHMKHRSVEGEPVDVQPLQPAQFAAVLADEPFVIIIDVRPFATYVCMRVRNAISICIPSTLLKRPTFGFNRIMDFVAPQDAERLQHLANASRVVFYDHSTSSLTALQNTPLARTAAKILAAEPTALAGKLYFVVGGITAILQQVPDLIQTDEKLQMQAEEEDAPKPSLGNLSTAPRSPFTLLPVVTAVRTSLASPVSTLSPRLPPLDDSTRLDAWPEVSANMDALPRWLVEAVLRTGSGQNVLAEAFQRLQAAESQRVSGSHSGRDRLSSRLISPRKPPVASKSARSSPIYMSPNSTVSSSYSASASANTSPVTASEPQQPQYLLVTGDDPAKNRYTNIAPFNHNRVVARGQYLNASFVSSQLSPLRYIATQAPVPASFADFWWCVWEQNVPLIVMLTVLTTESGQIKSHRYWDSGAYEGVYVDCVSESSVSDSGDNGIVLRRFVLEHKGEKRSVYQLQYERWPDLGCPATPDEVLRLVEIKGSIMAETQSLSDPVIVHCSAGCGRTGTFCTIDTVTDYMGRIGPDEARKDTTDRIFTTVSEFREQRIAMVQNQKQLLLCYESVMLWALKNYVQPQYVDDDAQMGQNQRRSAIV